LRWRSSLRKKCRLRKMKEESTSIHPAILKSAYKRLFSIPALATILMIIIFFSFINLEGDFNVQFIGIIFPFFLQGFILLTALCYQLIKRPDVLRSKVARMLCCLFPLVIPINILYTWITVLNFDLENIVSIMALCQSVFTILVVVWNYRMIDAKVKNTIFN
jgi:hypothetical protein